MIGCLAPCAGAVDSFSSLPPPERIPVNTDQQYMLALVVNGAEREHLVPVEFRQGHYWLNAADLQHAGLPASRLPAPRLDVCALPGVSAKYDAQHQRLLLQVPVDWLPRQSLAGNRQAPRHPARITPGAVLNYDLYGQRVDGGHVSLSAWSELRYFDHQGTFSSDGVWLQSISGNRSAQQGYTRYDTYWSTQDEVRRINMIVGDVATDALSWSNSVRIGGVQWARDFSVRPDLITYPLPSFNGSAALPSTVDVFVNGYRNSSNSIQPGPFSLTNLPFISGGGDAVIVTTDALGRRVATSLPFYVSSHLLTPGLDDYSLAGGLMRQGYGLRNIDYDQPVMSGSYRRGITDWLTLEGHTEAAGSLMLGGIGSLIKVGCWGVVNGALTGSGADSHTGNQYNGGYQYSNRYYTLSLQHSWRSPQYTNLARYGGHPGQGNIGSALSRYSAQYSASTTLNQYGNLGAAWIDIRSASGERASLWTFSWSKNLWGGASMILSGSRDRQQRDWSGVLTLFMPWQERISAGVNSERDSNGRTAQRLSLSRAMPTDGGLAWDVSYALMQRQADYQQVNLDYRSAYYDVAGGYYGNSHNQTEWADVSGALLWMDQQLFVSSPINNAFVLVKTGYPSVGLSYENQRVGATDRRGYLLVPGISAWYAGKYRIDTLDLPAEMTTPRVEQRVAVRRRSGYLLDFPVEPLRGASVILHDATGQPLPIATEIRRAGRPPAWVGWDGIVWLEDLQVDNPLSALAPDGRQCHSRLRLPDGHARALHTYGPLICPFTPTQERRSDDR